MAIRTTTAWTGLLKTPLAIYDELLKHFPLVQAATAVGADGLATMTIQVSQVQPPFIIESAVETTSFLQALTKLAQQILFDKIDGEEVRHPIDTRTFSSRARLQDWQKFRRIMYEKSGSSCLEALISYLRNPCAEARATLVLLGLSLEQVEQHNFRENDIEYFLEVSKKILQLAPQEKETLIAALERLFPSIFERILHKRSEDRIKEECRENHDPYQEMLPRLRAQVFGQDLATHALVSELVSQKSQGQNRTFLFIGPTGVGKTELAKAVAKEKKGLVTIFMNQYTSSGDVWKLFGSATGFVGASDKPNFAKEIDPYAVRVNSDYEVRNLVVLFDEFEKAHSAVKQSMLSLFDEGKYTAQYSLEMPRTNMIDNYVFKSCMFICTSNLFQEFLVDCFRHSLPIEEIRTGFAKLNSISTAQDICSPELLSRVTTIPFGPIPRGECYQNLLRGKLKKSLADFTKEFSCREFVVENEPLVVETLEKKFYGDGTDIRKVQRYFKEVNGIVYREKAKWGDMQTKKITIVCDANCGLCLKLSTFDLEFKRYCEGFPLVQLP